MLAAAFNEEMYLKGINYFNGWGRYGAVKWQTAGKDWRKDYYGRIPLWGCFNGKDTMEKEIEVASSYGVDFFKMLWYPTEPPREKGVEYLNGCFKDFLSCPNKDKLKFCLEFSNHNPFGIATDELWEKAVGEWVSYMKEPQYLRVDGKPVISFLWIHYFLEQCGYDEKLAEKRLSYLRETARKKGVGEILLGGGIIMDHIIKETTGKILRFFDFTTSYNSLPADLTNIDLNEQAKYPYKLLSAHVSTRRAALQMQMDRPYVPYLVSGWDPSPWSTTKKGKFFEFPTREEWRETLEELKIYLDETPESRLCGVKMFSIYAWNEYGEGGIIAPTVGEGNMKLEELKSVFGEQYGK